MTGFSILLLLVLAAVALWLLVPALAGRLLREPVRRGSAKNEPTDRLAETLFESWTDRA